jgi:uncharacterized RDD family membrane protein YckC
VKIIFLKRVSASLIDGILFWVVARLAGFSHGNLLVLWLFFEAAMVSEWEGYTIGKKMNGIKIMDDQGNPVNFSKAFIRSLAKVVSTLVFLLGDLWMLWDKDSRTWHDKLSRTVVVKHDR